MKYQQHGAPMRKAHGDCGLCGRFGKLSKTHAPPKSAGNKGKTRFAVERFDESGTSTTVFSRARDGGMWGWWLCEPCNHLTRPYDEEFTRWAIPVALDMESTRPRSGSMIYLRCASADPAAFVRALWAWSFALDAELRTDYPDVAAAVITGGAVAGPHDHRMLLGATTDLRIFMAMQRGGQLMRTRAGSDGWHQTSAGFFVPGPEVLPVPRLAISAPPFVALLAHADDETKIPYLDTASWLEETIGTHREVCAELPVTRPVPADGAPRLVSYDELAA